MRAQRGRGDKDPAKRWTRWEAAVSAVGEAEPIADAVADEATDKKLAPSTTGKKKRSRKAQGE